MPLGVRQNHHHHMSKQASVASPSTSSPSPPTTSAKGRHYKRRFSLQPLSLSLSLRESSSDSGKAGHEFASSGSLDTGGLFREEEGGCSTGENESGGKTAIKTRYKVVVMGAAKVGKTAIVHQFLYDAFPTKYKKTIEEMHHGEYELGGTSLTLDILDTSGSFEFPAMRALSISSADAFLLVFSLADSETFLEVQAIREQVLSTKGSEVVPIVVVGNKRDLVADDTNEARAIERETNETIVKIDWENGYAECSAKYNDNVVQVFKELLIQAKVKYNLSPAVRKRRQSLPHPASSSASVSPGNMHPTPAQLHHLNQIASGKASSCDSGDNGDGGGGGSSGSNAKRNSCILS